MRRRQYFISADEILRRPELGVSVVPFAFAQSDDGRGGAADLERGHHIERLERPHRQRAVAGIGEEAELLFRVERHVVVAEVTLHGALADLQRLQDLGVRTVAVAVRVQCDDLQGVFNVDALGVVVEDERIRLPVRSHGDFLGDSLGAFLDPERDDHRLRLGILGLSSTTALFSSFPVVKTTWWPWFTNAPLRRGPDQFIFRLFADLVSRFHHPRRRSQ